MFEEDRMPAAPPEPPAEAHSDSFPVALLLEAYDQIRSLAESSRSPSPRPRQRLVVSWTFRHHRYTVSHSSLTYFLPSLCRCRSIYRLRLKLLRWRPVETVT